MTHAAQLRIELINAHQVIQDQEKEIAQLRANDHNEHVQRTARALLLSITKDETVPAYLRRKAAEAL